MQKRKNRWYIAVVAVIILAVVLVLAVVLGKKGKNKKDPKMIEPTQQEQASEIPRKYLIIPLRRPQRQNRFRSPLLASREFSLMWMPERFWLEKMH